MRKRVAGLILTAICSTVLGTAWPVFARQVYVEGYPTKGTPEQEEQWYDQHVEWCLERIMAYPKTKGRSIKRAVSWGGGGSEMIISDDWYGQTHVSKSQKVADWWAEQDDEYLYGRIPADPPSELCLGYHVGCPIHGGMRGTLSADLHQPYHYQCSRGKEWWYPGCKVENPTSGEEVTVVDDGNGWTAPEGFAGAGTTYHFKRTYPADLIKKYVWGGPYGGEVNRKDPSGWPPALALSIMYETTGDAKYAHAQGILLNRLAEVYRTYYRPQYYRRGKATTTRRSRWAQLHRMCPANFEPQHMETISIAYDLAFEGIAKDPSIVEFFATKGDADYNGDGKLTPEDITYNIQKNLFGYMYELMHRSYHMGQGAQKAVFTIAMVCQNPIIFADAVEELNLMVDNEHFRDGMNWEDSSSYRGCSKGYVNAAKYLEGFCDGEIIKEPFDLLGDPNYKLNKYLSCDPLRSCDGRKLAIGDSGNRRTPIAPTAPADGKLAQSVLFDGAGYAILRAGKDVNTRKHLLVYFSQSSNAHGHWDQLHLQPVAYGYDLSMQIGYWASGGPGKHHAFNKGTVNHNTVEVDIKAQNMVSMGTLKLYGITNPVKVCEVSSASAYDQCSVYRRVAALINVGPDEHFIADIFRVAGGKTHDYLWHSLGGDNAENFEIATEENATFSVQEHGTLLGEDIAFGTEKHIGTSGYSWLKDVARARTDKGWTAAWLADPEQQIGLRLHMTGAPGREVITCKGEGYGIVGESPWDAYTVTRHQSETEPCVSIFAAVIEPHKGETFISDVRRVQMEPYTALQPGLEPVAMVVETTRDKTFYILHNPERDTPRTLEVDGHSFELTGQFATVCFTGGKFDYGMLGNGEWLSVDGNSIEAESVVSGRIVSIDVEKNVVEVEAEKPLQVKAVDQGNVTFYNPGYARGETFPLAGVEHPGGKRYRLDLGHTWLYEGRGKVTSVDAETNTMLTMTSQYKLFCGICYDGKWLRASDKNDAGAWLQIENASESFSVADGAKFTLQEPGSAAKMKPGDLFWVYSIAPGDSFEIGNTAVLGAEDK